MLTSVTIKFLSEGQNILTILIIPNATIANTD